jgi:hypothetical protein
MQGGNMRTKMVAALVAVVGSLAMAPAAQADWYISKRTGQSFARRDRVA